MILLKLVRHALYAIRVSKYQSWYCPESEPVHWDHNELRVIHYNARTFLGLRQFNKLLILFPYEEVENKISVPTAPIIYRKRASGFICMKHIPKMKPVKPSSSGTGIKSTYYPTVRFRTKTSICSVTLAYQAISVLSLWNVKS